MTDLEKAEKLREKADVSFAEAKEALDIANGDILDALIYLEKRGKSTVPAGGGFFSSADGAGTEQQSEPEYECRSEKYGESFWDILKRFGRFCKLSIRKGATNFLDATKNGDLMFSCPVIMLVAFIVFFFWITIPLFIISLFFGFRYRFRGSDLGRESVNRVMDNASEIAEDVKKNFSKKQDNYDSEE